MKVNKTQKITSDFDKEVKKILGNGGDLMVLLCTGMILTIVRWVSAFNDNIIVINSEINSHISNLSLSMILYLGIGYSWLINGMKFRYIVILGAILSVVKQNDHQEFDKYFKIAKENGMNEVVLERKLKELSEIKKTFELASE